MEKDIYYEEPNGIRDINRKTIPVVTLILITINVIVYFYSEFTGSSLDSSHMIDLGAMYEPLFFEGKEYYRLISHFFLHFGAEHLGNNMISLFFLGYIMEPALGKIRFLGLYFISGILAGLSSIVYNKYMIGEIVVSCGASGAIYGLMGAFLLTLLLKRKTIKEGLPRYILFLIITVYGGMRDPSIDGAAHFGGLVSGFLICGFICLLNAKLRERIRRA